MNARSSTLHSSYIASLLKPPGFNRALTNLPRDKHWARAYAFESARRNMRTNRRTRLGTHVPLLQSLPIKLSMMPASSPINVISAPPPVTNPNSPLLQQRQRRAFVWLCVMRL